MWVGDGEQKNDESKPGGITIIVESGIVVTECPPCVRGSYVWAKRGREIDFSFQVVVMAESTMSSFNHLSMGTAVFRTKFRTLYSTEPISS